jgi:uncharacterized protein YegP (UPF0339 family)
MATATKKARAARQFPRRAPDMRPLEPMEFLIYEDNGGGYHWTIVDCDGVTLARSRGFATYDDAEAAAQHVRDGAASALHERRNGGASPVDLEVRLDVMSDDSDPEGWLDDRGSISKGVATSQAPR